MAAWRSDELVTIGGSEEVDIAPIRRDGTVHNRVTLWIVRHADDLYVRSAVNGRRAAWFRAVQQTQVGRIWAGAMQKDVTFVDAYHGLDDEIDAVYRSKYRRFAGRILNSCLTPEARSTTLRLMPR